MDDDAIDGLTDRKDIELARAKIELKLRNKELQKPTGRIREILKTPAFLAAVVPTVITVLLTGATIVLQNNKAANDKLVEEARFEQETDRTILLDVMKSADAAQAASMLGVFLETGLIHDKDGKFKNVQSKLEDRFRQQILLNILRQSTNEPLSFEEVKMNSPFLVGFLKPIDLETMDYFFRLGYPREMLWWLFIDSIEIGSDDRSIGVRYDPPNDAGCSPADEKKLCFTDYIRLITAAGLAVETVYVTSAKGYQSAGESRSTSYSRFCFNPVLAQSAQGAMGIERRDELARRLSDVPVDAISPKCASPWNPAEDAGKPQGDTVPFTIGSKQFKVTSRSALSLFQFLGNLVKLEAYAQPEHVQKMNVPALWTVADDEKLFNVSVATKTDRTKCFVSTEFHGTNYCVPDDAQNSKRIFGVLSQLIGIQTP